MYKDGDELLELLRTRDEAYWITEGQRMAIELFRRAAVRVPAYKDFLHTNGVKPEQVKTMQEFHALPILDRDNYISRYRLEERCWDGQLASGSIVSYSSGTSGVPTLWPRFEEQEQESVLFHDIVLREIFSVEKQKTLLVICFALGFHIAGMITSNAIERLLKKKYPITLVTPGKNKEDILILLKALGFEYEQIILFGHPGFIKAIIDDVVSSMPGIKQRLRCVVSGGGFFESWREHLLRETEQSEKTRIIGLYGCTDIGALAHETIDSIMLRNRLRNEQALATTLLGKSVEHEPHLFQYIPSLRYIESLGGALIITAPGGVPLVRYNLQDRGQILPYGALAQSHTTPSAHSWQIPFIALYGRPKVVVVNGANVYMEHIQRALEHERCMPHITGRFVASVEYNEAHNEQFVVHIESKDVSISSQELEAWLKEHVISSLMEYNREYADCVRAMGERVHPHIKLSIRGDAVFLRSGESKKKL